MTTIGIISDTHAHWDPRFEQHFKNCDQIWHAGDVGCDDTLQRLRQLAPVVHAVSGNIDTGMVRRLCPETDIFQVEDVKIYLTHIGGYPGRYAPGVRRSLIEHRPKIMVAGHSHILRVMFDHELDLLHINPGAAGTHGWQKERTLIRLKINGPRIFDLEVIELGKLKI